MPIPDRSSLPARRAAPPTPAAAPATSAGAPSTAAAANSPTAAALPTHPMHAVSGWTPRSSPQEYGFGLTVRFSSTSGNVDDLLNQGSQLKVRRKIRFHHNGFAPYHTPPNPLYDPSAGTPFTGSYMTKVSRNQVELKKEEVHKIMNAAIQIPGGIHRGRLMPSRPNAPRSLVGEQTYEASVAGGSWNPIGSWSYLVERSLFGTKQGAGGASGLLVLVKLGNVHTTVAPYRP